MKKIFLLLFCLFTLSSSSPVAHEFYMSVTEIEYKKDKNSLQIITRVFIDDFENVLRQRYDDDIRLSYEKEEGDVRKYIQKYLEQKLKLETGDQNLKLNFLGKEYDADQIVLYIEAENVMPFKTITVQNSILMDLFNDQKNVVHVTLNNTTKSLLLDSGANTERLNF